MDLNLNEHAVVVTGGASGIGKAIARGFLAEGSRIAIWDVSETVESVVADIAADVAENAAQKAIACRVDVTDEAAVAQAVEETESRLGPLDHLVHCAAVGSGKYGFPFTNLDPSDWNRVLDINVKGMVHVAHAVAPAMQQRNAGTMVFIASVAGQIGSPTDPPYIASKAANINFAQCIAKDLGPFGIRVNTICPGMVSTPLNQSVWRAWNDLQPPEKKRGYEDWAGEKIERVCPLGRWQQPGDIADMALFLSSDRAAQVTGQTINVDGGFVMHW